MHDPNPADSAEPGRAAQTGPSRRSFLVGTGLVAGAAVLAGPGRLASAAATPDTTTGGTPPVVYADQVRSVRPGEVLPLAGSGLTSGVLIELWLIPDDTSAPASLTAVPATPPSGSVSLTATDPEGDNLVIVVPATTTDGAYAVYVSGDSGSTWSAPLLLNAAQPWYLDQPTSAPGDVVTVIGPSVAHSAPTTKTAQVYLRSSSGTLTPVAVSVTSDYELAFTVPSTLAVGNYTVLVSNGLGGHYGYDASLTLTVAAAAASPTTSYDIVADFGADPSGAHDSTTGIQNALDAAAASGGARALFPAGNYAISSKLTLGAGTGVIEIVGATNGTTTVLMSDSSVFSPTVTPETSVDFFGCTAGDDHGMLYLAPSTHPVRLAGIGFGSNGKRPVILEIDGRTGTTVTDCRFVGDSYPENIWLYAGVCSILVQNTRGLRVANCSFTCNKGIYLSNVVDTRVEDNTFAIYFPRLPTDPATQNGQVDNDGVQVWGARRLTIRGNQFTRGSSTYHYARAVQTGAVKLWATTWGPTDACGVQDVLMAHNTVDSAGEPGKNNGEAMVGDGIKVPTGGGALTAVDSATSNTVTPSGATFTLHTLTDPVGSYVFVVAGTGAGQIRRVVDNTTTTLTVEYAWEVVPDTSSVVVVQNVHARQLFVHNTITACGKYVGNYGPSVLSIVADNTVDSTGAPGTVSAMTGAGFFSIYGVDSTGAYNSQPAFYNVVADNQLTGADAFLSYQNYAKGAVPAAPLVRGNVVARNTASGVTQTVVLADSTLGGSPAATWGRYNAIVKNELGSGVAYQATVDGRFDHTVYQGAATELASGGTNPVVVPG
ncbi:hypothetical protein OHA18_23110 [Kribbella sp. NBC_00709]|uniref:glycosyl hydrolase family 28-related protein n=1 Tax=Kribbella sp. NBC_00709 TaxID=2975972 RepID=UPI002E2D11D4|nr:glycosyl hydrolase family 28-related protein [Kribbella sp. NBC_00709]